MPFFVLMIVCDSCFLWSDLKRSSFSYTKDGKNYTTRLMVPKGYNRTERQVDSVGNLVKYYFYPDHTVLYFAALTDTSKEYQPVNYAVNIPKELYQTVFFKGIDSSYRYWRETRFDHFKAGYRNVDAGSDGVFDSALNYFSLHVKRRRMNNSMVYYTNEKSARFSKGTVLCSPLRRSFTTQAF